MTSSREPARSPLGPKGSAKSGASPLERPWRGETYYDRPQLKPAPFSATVVGAYVFLAGLSGSAAMLGALAQATGGDDRRPMTRRAHYLALLAPTLGSALLVYDLHTPQRFYNMLRVAKKTSPMSIGTWLLMGFSAAAGTGGLAQVANDLRPRWRWPRRVAGAALVPAALFGAGISTYTAALVAATSTPVWAAAPRSNAIRFASSAVASGAAALAMGEASPSVRRALADLLLAALAIDLAATLTNNGELDKAGIGDARSGRWAWLERIGASGLGVLLPIGLLLGSRFLGRRPSELDAAAGVLALAGSAAFRISILGLGIDSAARPEVSLRFAQPDNLPQP